MTLLFGNLFFGLLLSVFGSLYEIHKSGKKLTHNEIQKAQLLDANNEDETQTLGKEENGNETVQDSNSNSFESSKYKLSKQESNGIRKKSDVLIANNTLDSDALCVVNDVLQQSEEIDDAKLAMLSTTITQTIDEDPIREELENIELTK